MGPKNFYYAKETNNKTYSIVENISKLCDQQGVNIPKIEISHNSIPKITDNPIKNRQRTQIDTFPKKIYR